MGVRMLRDQLNRAEIGRKRVGKMMSHVYDTISILYQETQKTLAKGT